MCLLTAFFNEKKTCNYEKVNIDEIKYLQLKRREDLKTQVKNEYKFYLIKKIKKIVDVISIELKKVL